MTKAKSQLKNLSENKRIELYGYAKRLFDYKWSKSISIKEKDMTYEGKMFPELRVLQEYGFIKKVGPAEPNFKYKLKRVDWWELATFVYNTFSEIAIRKMGKYSKQRAKKRIYKVYR